jgi:hypothetical protein
MWPLGLMFLFHYYILDIFLNQRTVKGLEPKLLDLALSMGENKTLNVKVVTSLKRLQDIMLSTSISNFV